MISEETALEKKEWKTKRYRNKSSTADIEPTSAAYTAANKLFCTCKCDSASIDDCVLAKERL